MFCGADAVTVPCRDFGATGRAVLERAADVAVLPVENSIAGSVGGSYEVLLDPEFVVIGEVVAPIHHCLLAVPPARMEDLQRVLSHPVALAQCGRFLREHRPMEAVAWYDTAGAAQHVAQLKDPRVAAIAGQHAAARYGLAVLLSDIEDRPDNQTRFLVIAARSRLPDLPVQRGDAGFRTSLQIETKDVPGALARVLNVFAERSLNLSKLEARPGETPWSYLFFIDIDAAVDDVAMKDSLRALDDVAETRVLGSYPRRPATTTISPSRHPQ